MATTEREEGPAGTDPSTELPNAEHDDTASDVEWRAQAIRSHDHNYRAYYEGRSIGWWYREYRRAGAA